MKKQYIVIILLIIIITLIFIFKREGVVAPTVAENATVYTNPTQTFSVNIPRGFTVDDQYSYSVTPTRSLRGVKFTIPESLKKDTNLSSDSYISIESIPGAEYCTAERFFDFAPQVPDTIIENNITYSINYAQDAGAGNRYEETIYAIKDSNPCVAIRYFIHYSAIENYPEGAVREFDRAALLAELDGIRRSMRMK